MKRIAVACLLFLLTVGSWSPLFAHNPVPDPLGLKSTVFGRAAEKHGVPLYILYAVALRESRRISADGLARPYEFTLRLNGNGKVLYPANAVSAREALQQLIAQHSENSELPSIDIGAMQISCIWHCDKVSSPLDLLSLPINVDVGAQILAEAMKSTQDTILGIGRYHNWKDETRARKYGSEVFRLAVKLASL